MPTNDQGPERISSGQSGRGPKSFPDRLPGRMLDGRRRAHARRHGSNDEVAMRREMTRWRAMANAVFVLAVLGLAGYGIRQVSSRNWAWQPTFHARAGFSTIGGIEVGAKVRVQGIDAGVVEAVEPPEAPAARSSSGSGSTSGSVPWSGPTRRRGSSRRASSGRRSSRSSRAGPTPRRWPTDGRSGRRDPDRAGRPAQGGLGLAQAGRRRRRGGRARAWARSTRSPPRSARGRGAWASSSATTRRTRRSSR